MSETTAPFPSGSRSGRIRALDENTPLTLKLGVLITLASATAVSAIAWNNVRRDVDATVAAAAKLETRADRQDELLREQRERLIRIEAKIDNLK